MSSSESPPPSPPPVLFDGVGTSPDAGQPSSTAFPPGGPTTYPLEEEFWETDAARLRRWLPWLNMFQGFRLAMDYRKLTLGLVAVVLLAAGEWVFAYLPFASSTFRAPWPWDDDYSRVEFGPAFVEPGAPLGQGSGLNWLSQSLDLKVIRPYLDFFNSGWPLVSSSGNWSTMAMSWTRLLWLLFVCGVCGGTIARLAALNFAGKDCSLRAALVYTTRRIFSFMGGPLLPVVGIGVLWLLCAAGGLAATIPFFGGWLAAIFWFLPLILGLMMAIILLGVAAGWPLMYATVSTEGSDAFDGLSRSYSYLFSRPWYALWLLVVASLYGSMLVLFLHVVLDLGARCAERAVQSGAGEAGLRAIAPSRFPGEMPGVSWVGHVTEFWLNLLRSGLPAFLFSYFWTAVTIAYLLLRKSVDSTPLDAVDEDLPPSPAGDFPLVGVPAVERREAAARAAAQSTAATPAPATTPGPAPGDPPLPPEAASPPTS